MSRALVALILLACAASGARADAVPAEGVPPPGASALDAWGAWRDAEAGTYRLAEDGVHRFSCDVSSSLVDLLSAPDAPF